MKATENGNGSLKQQFWIWLWKNGPWVVLVFLLLGGISYEAHQFLGQVAPVVTNYVTAAKSLEEENAKTIKVISDAQANAETTRQTIMVGIQLVQQRLEKREAEHMKQQEVLDKLLNQIEQAYKMMAESPKQRQEMILVLSEIKIGIDKLVKDSTEAPP